MTNDSRRDRVDAAFRALVKQANPEGQAVVGFGVDIAPAVEHIDIDVARISGYINARLRVTGHLFQGRFGSVDMDEPHLLAAFRYVAMNPVKAQLVRQASD